MQLGLATSQLNITFAQQEVLKIGANHFVLLLVSWELDGKHVHQNIAEFSLDVAPLICTSSESFGVLFSHGLGR